MSGRKIVVIEDDPAVSKLLESILTAELFQVGFADSGEAGLETVIRELPSLVLLDVLLPGIDGVEVCRQLKQNPATRRIPIIMVSGKTEESDIVLGLGVGADDYVTKPFRPKELVARVKAVQRISVNPQGEEASDDRVARLGLVIDPSWHQATVDGRPLRLTVTELRLLHLLASNPGRVFTRDQMVSRAIGPDSEVTLRNIDVHVRSIREKLGSWRHLIGTVRGVGYRFRTEEPSGRYV